METPIVIEHLDVVLKQLFDGSESKRFHYTQPCQYNHIETFKVEVINWLALFA